MTAMPHLETNEHTGSPACVEIVCCVCGVATKYGVYNLRYLDGLQKQITGRTLCGSCAEGYTLGRSATTAGKNNTPVWVHHKHLLGR